MIPIFQCRCQSCVRANDECVQGRGEEKLPGAIWHHGAGLFQAVIFIEGGAVTDCGVKKLPCMGFLNFFYSL